MPCLACTCNFTLGLVAVTFAMFGLLLEMTKVAKLMGQSNEVRKEHSTSEHMIEGFDAVGIDVFTLVIDDESFISVFDLVTGEQGADESRNILDLDVADAVEELHRHSRRTLRAQREQDRKGRAKTYKK